MARDKKIEVFQDLYIRGPATGREFLRRTLIQKASGPWRHAEDREKGIGASAEPKIDVIAFEREGNANVDAVALVLCSREEGYEVTNIVPREVGELGENRYNIALRDFVDCVANSAAKEVEFTLEISSPMQGLDDWLPMEAADALRRFSDLANKSTGSSHPMDRDRWFAFLLAVQRNRGTFDSDQLTRWLTEVDGWSHDMAFDLAIQFEFAVSLLSEYDRDRT